MKVLLVTIGVIVGAAAVWVFAPRTELVEAGVYLATPNVQVRCDGWIIQETGPDYYWDGEVDSTSTADYYTVDDNPEQYARGEFALLTPKPAGAYNKHEISMTWWDSDRGTPEPLTTVAVRVQPRAYCP